MHIAFVEYATKPRRPSMALNLTKKTGHATVVTI